MLDVGPGLSYWISGIFHVILNVVSVRMFFLNLYSVVIYGKINIINFLVLDNPFLLTTLLL